MCKPLNNAFQNLEVIFTSLSDIIFFETPCNLTTSQINTFATSLAGNVDLTEMKCATFVNLSKVTMMESCYLIICDKIAMKFMELTSHFHSGITVVCSNPSIFLHSAFTR